MKKIYTLLFSCLATVNSFGQVVTIFNAPPDNNATTQVRAPNGTSSHTTLRGVFHITAAEMTVSSPTAAINAFGFNLINGVAGAAVSGSLTVYFQHTADLTNIKSTTWATAIAGMTTVYNNNMTIPVSSTATFVDLPLPSVFSYTGGNFYVAYDWISNGPFSATPATYAANNSIPAPAGLTASSATTVAPLTLGATAFRPAFRFSALNSYTNEVSVNYIATPALLATVNGTSHAVQALVRNNSNTTLNNIPVSLNISGAVVFNNTLTIPSLAAGATSSVTFPAYTISSGLMGVNSISVSVPNDQNNSNNLKVYSQNLMCNTQALGPDVVGPMFANGIGFNTASGLLLNRMRFEGNNTINSIDVAISSATTNLGNNVYAVVTNSLGTILATSNTITITNPNLGVYNNFTITPLPVLSGVNYYIGLAQPSNSVVGYFPVASFTSATIITPSLSLYSSAITGGVPVAQNPNLGFLGIKANVQGICAIASPTANFTFPTPICSSVTTLFSNTSSGATSYTWNFPGGSPATTTITNGVTVYNTAGIYTVTLIASNGSTTSIIQNTINVNATPVLTTNFSPTLCAGSSLTLTASGANSYTWNPGSVNTSSIVISPLTNTSYSLIGTSSAGCQSALNVLTATVIPNPTLNITSSSNSICVGATASITVTGASSYSWNTGATTSVIAVSPTVTSNYNVTGINSNGCSSTSSIALTVNNCTDLKNINTTLYNSINIFPNPSSNFVTVQLIGKQFNVKLFNVLGAVIQNMSNVNGEITIPVQNVAKGVYFISITCEGIETTKKLIIE